MFTLTFLSQKGNVGKTTLALSVAVLAAAEGQAVVMIDVDPQATAANWKDRRTGDNPIVTCAPITRLTPTLDTARSNGADLVIIDCPGMNQSGAIEAAKKADLVLIPTPPRPFEMETLPTVRNLVRAANDPPAFVVYNLVHPSGHRQAEELKAKTMEFCDLPACPVHMTQRTIYADAPAYGKAPQEQEPNGKAADEIRQLYLFIKSHAAM